MIAARERLPFLRAAAAPFLGADDGWGLGMGAPAAGSVAPLPCGFGWEGAGFNKEELGAVRGWLGGKATSIFAGSHEVQNNIISKRILALPDSLATQSN